MATQSLSVPGILYVGTSGEQTLSVLHVGPAVGWMALKGLHTWSREISLVLKVDVPDALRRSLSVTMPEDLPTAMKHPHARKAAQASSHVAVESALVDKLVAKGVRVHTIGCDRVTGGIYYFAKGGSGEGVRFQGNLFEMVAPTLGASSDNAALEALLDGLIGRILAELSDGVTEAQVELAAALPSLGEAAPEAAIKLETLEGFLVLSSTRATRYEERARTVVETVGQATRQGKEEIEVPLFGQARRVVQPEVEIEYTEGEAGARRKLTLPERGRWLVAGLPPESVAPTPAAPQVDEKKAAVERAAREKAAADRAAAERATAERAAAEKAAADRAAAARAAEERAAAENAAAERAAKEKAEAKAAEERAAAEKATAARTAKEKGEAKAAKEMAEARAAREKSDAKAAREKSEAKTAGDQALATKEAERAERAQTTGKVPRVAARGAAKRASSGSTPAWVWLVLAVVALVGVFYFRYLRHHH